MPCKNPGDTFFVIKPDPAKLSQAEAELAALESEKISLVLSRNATSNAIDQGRTDLLDQLNNIISELELKEQEITRKKEEIEAIRESLGATFMVQGADPSWWNGQFNPYWARVTEDLNNRQGFYEYDPWREKDPREITRGKIWNELVGAGRTQNGTVNFTYSFIPAGVGVPALYGGVTVDIKDHVGGNEGRGNPQITKSVFMSQVTEAFQEWKEVIEHELKGVTVNFINLGEEVQNPNPGVYGLPPISEGIGSYPIPEGADPNFNCNIGDFRIGMSRFSTFYSVDNHPALAVAYSPQHDQGLSQVDIEMARKGKYITVHQYPYNLYYDNADSIAGVSGSFGGDILFDADDAWRTDALGVGSAGYTGDFSIKWVAGHEIGHALGIGHTSLSGSIMNGIVNPYTDSFNQIYGQKGFLHPAAQDVRDAIRGIYGPLQELDGGQTFMVQQEKYYIENFEDYPVGERLYYDGGFARTLIEGYNSLGETQYYDNFTIRETDGVDRSKGATCTNPSCLTLACWNWDAMTTRFNTIKMQASFKFNPVQDRVLSFKEIVYFNFANSLEPQASIVNASRRLGIMFGQNGNGDYEIFATDKVAVTSSIGNAVIPKAQIERTDTASNWLQISFEIQRQDDRDAWTMVGKLHSLGPDGTSSPSLLMEGTVGDLIDDRLWAFQPSFFQFFVYGMSDPDPQISSFTLDNFALFPIKGTVPAIEDRDEALRAF